MDIRSALPSAQFMLVVCSVAVAAALVFSTDRLVRSREAPGQLAVSPAAQQQTAEDADWQATLAHIQAENPALPPPPPADAYQALLADARNATSVTDSVSRALFVNLTNAGLQGLGSDIPTQDQLVASAVAELDARTAKNAYVLADLTVVPDSPTALRAYGNAVMALTESQPRANVQETYATLGLAVDKDDRTYFEQLKPMEQAYQALAEGMRAMPVPRTLAPLHLVLVNDFFKMTGTYADLRAMPDDPLRGLAGLHHFQTLADEAGRVFTTIAQQLQQNAILFTEDEPGRAWSALLSVSP